MRDAEFSPPSGYFDVYREERPSFAPRQYAPRSRRKPRPPVLSPDSLVSSSAGADGNTGGNSNSQKSPGTISAQLNFFTAPLAEPPLSRRRQASARHSRQPSSGASPTTTSSSTFLPQPPDSPFSDIHLSHARPGPSTDTLDALYEALPKSPGRRGRAHDRGQRKRSDSRRKREQEMDWHSRELAAKLRSLATKREDSVDSTQSSSGRSATSRASFSSTSALPDPEPGTAKPFPPMQEPPSLLFDEPVVNVSGSRKATSFSSSSLPALSLQNSAGQHLGVAPAPGATSIPFSSQARTLPLSQKSRIPSIHELVSAHQSRLQAAPARTPSFDLSATPKAPSSSSHKSEPPQTASSSHDDSDASSVDSIFAEAVGTSSFALSPHLTPPSQTNTRLKPSRSMSDMSQQQSISSYSNTSVKSTEQLEIARFLRSPRLTRLLRLPGLRSNALQVSLADVGDPEGHPVVVFLGLGCVRHLVALYDELAEAMHLRLICIDRWGLGQTTAVPDSHWGFLEWAKVVDAVADELCLGRFSLLAHSAGAPYALATSLRCADRVSGSLHLLAPWVNNSVKGQGSQYKLLKLIPNTLLTTAQAAEWKVQAWKLGRPLASPNESESFTARGPVSSAQYSSPPSPIETLLDDLPDTGTRTVSNAASRTSRRRKASIPSFFTAKRSMTDVIPRPSTAGPLARPDLTRSPTSADGGERSMTPNSRRSMSTSNGRSSLASPDSPGSARDTASELSGKTASPRLHSATDLATALLKASYSESLAGGTQDLLAILERTNKPYGFAYSDVQHPVKVWHGDKDDRVSFASVQAFQQSLPHCTLKLVAGAAHGLMTNTGVMYEVLDSIREESISLHL